MRRRAKQRRRSTWGFLSGVFDFGDANAVRQAAAPTRTSVRGKHANQCGDREATRSHAGASAHCGSTANGILRLGGPRLRVPCDSPSTPATTLAPTASMPRAALAIAGLPAGIFALARVVVVTPLPPPTFRAGGSLASPARIRPTDPRPESNATVHFLHRFRPEWELRHKMTGSGHRCPFSGRACTRPASPTRRRGRRTCLSHLPRDGGRGGPEYLRHSSFSCA
jgi:hypothetical protein